MISRCEWAGEDRIYQEYHDNEWGVPVHDDRRLFEMLILEGMQAGLSWITILKKRENFREAFDGFDFDIVAGYGDEKIAELMENKGIIRNRLKIKAAVKNAIAFKEIRKEYGSFDSYIWSYVDNVPVVGGFTLTEEIPVKTELSDRISKDLKKRGFSFVGSTIIYSYLQAVGIVNDHIVDCFVYKKLIKDS